MRSAPGAAWWPAVGLGLAASLLAVEVAATYPLVPTLLLAWAIAQPPRLVRLGGLLAGHGAFGAFIAFEASVACAGDAATRCGTGRGAAVLLVEAACFGGVGLLLGHLAPRRAGRAPAPLPPPRV